jgi:DNA processing protein
MAFPEPGTLAEARCPAWPAASEIQPSDPRYPSRLGSLPVPPRSLWFSGRVPDGRERLIAMVGARAATGAGRQRAFDLAAALGRTGFAIVSGGAFGIDAAAHEGAMAARARTYAVLGCGTDIAYPDRHAGLFARMAECGGLLSEYPPGTQPRRGQFPARNRIIAALGEAVIVVEAAMRSGALITARLGRALGRPLLAVAGSTGADALLRSGQALSVGSIDDVQAALAGQLPPPQPFAPAARPHEDLLAAIELGAKTPGLLCRRLGLPLPSLLARLAEAELDGLIQRAGGDTYEVIDGPG